MSTHRTHRHRPAPRAAVAPVAAMLLALALVGCGARSAYDPNRIHGQPTSDRVVDEEATGALAPGEGKATWCGQELDGNLTASGEPFDYYAFAAAHRTLRFGTWVRVTRLDDGRFVDVRINDRGPFTRGRIIDLTWAAARALGMLQAGVVDVRIEVLR